VEKLTLKWIHEKVQKDQYLLSLHADEERRADGLDIEDLEEALLNGKILEDYPEDTRGASCLLYGTSQERPVHVVCGKNRSGWLVIITVYVPSEPKWESPTKRRGK
jgi:hypothetical protein